MGLSVKAIVRHAAIIGVAVASALGAAQGVTALAGGRAAASPAPIAASSAPIAPPLAEPSPALAETAAQVSKAADGHYWAQANVDGRWIKFLVDTGASSVALTGDDARRLGFDLATLDYSRPVTTASGKTLAAPVTLETVSVAGARVEHVDALVLKDGLATSLLGMSYLGRLSRFEATRTALILRP